MLLLARSPISSSLFQSLHPETNLPLALIKVKIPQLLYKTATGRAHSNPAAGDNLSSPSLLLPLCVFPAFIRLSHPAQLPSCYLLTRTLTLSPPCCVFKPCSRSYPPVCVRARVFVCVSATPYIAEIFSKKRKIAIITAAKCRQPHLPSSFSCKISRLSVTLRSPSTLFRAQTQLPFFSPMTLLSLFLPLFSHVQR